MRQPRIILAIGLLAGATLLVGQNAMQRMGGTAHQLLHGGSPTTFGAVDLTTEVTGVLPAGNGGAGPVSWWAPFGLNGVPPAGYTISQSGGSQVYVWPFSLPASITLNKIGFRLGATGLSAGQAINLAIYDATGASGNAGALVVGATPLTSGSGNTVQQVSTAGTPLAPGSYYIGITADNASVTFNVFADTSAPASFTNAISTLMGRKAGNCTNRATGTGSSLAFPSSCGTVTDLALSAWPVVILGN